MNLAKRLVSVSAKPAQAGVVATLALAVMFAPTLFAHQSRPTRKYEILYYFQGGDDGNYPAAGLLRDKTGNLYGTTPQGGDLDGGTLFKLDRAGNKTILHSFGGPPDGLMPGAALVEDVAGNLYGTTLRGGTGNNGCDNQGCGTVFKLDTSGQETVLYSFPGGRQGANPSALVVDKTGNLYGIAGLGGLVQHCHPSGCGLIFKLDTTGKVTIVYAFNGRGDGAYPNGTLVMDQAGNLYGTTERGGQCSCGIIFELDTKGTERVIYSFTGGTHGIGPIGLVRDQAGNFYGTAGGGDTNCNPPNGCGIVFKVDQTRTETVLHSFTGGIADGAFPNTGVTMDPDGNLYGTTGGGGNDCSGSGCGTVFEVDAADNETILHKFSGNNGNGISSQTALVRAPSGTLYGTTWMGGSDNNGVVFKLTP